MLTVRIGFADEAEHERVRRTLHLALLSAKCEQDRVVLRCALNLLTGAEPFEIDPTTGVAYTVAAFRRITSGWVRHYTEYDRREDGEFWQHRIAEEGRAIQARYAAVHPELAEPIWFPNHGPAVCVFCLMEANEAAGLPVETGMDPVTGRVAQTGPAGTA